MDARGQRRGVPCAESATHFGRNGPRARDRPATRNQSGEKRLPSLGGLVCENHRADAFFRQYSSSFCEGIAHRPLEPTAILRPRIYDFGLILNGLGGPISLDSPRAETRCTPDGFRLPSMWIVTPLAGFPREVLTRADLVRGWMRARACLHGAARQNPRNGARRRIFAASARGIVGEAVAAVTRPPGDGRGRPRRASCRPATSAAGDGCRTRSSRR